MQVTQATQTTPRSLCLAISVILAIIGAAIGAVVTWQLVPIAGNCQVLYVSQDEIIELENARIKQDKLEERQLFYGEVEKAVRLAAEIPRSYQNRTTKVIYSMSAVTGDNVKSISKEVHQGIIKELNKQTKQ